MTFAQAGQLVLDEFDVPVRDAVAGRWGNEFWAPGSTLKVKVDTSNPYAYGMPEDALIAYLAGGQVYETVAGARSGDVRRVLTYPGRDILQSGWLLGEEAIADKAAMVSVKHGEGTIVMIGFPGPAPRPRPTAPSSSSSTPWSASRGERRSSDRHRRAERDETAVHSTAGTAHRHRSAGLRPASRGSAKPGPVAPCRGYAHVVPERRGATGQVLLTEAGQTFRTLGHSRLDWNRSVKRSGRAATGFWPRRPVPGTP